MNTKLILVFIISLFACSSVIAENTTQNLDIAKAGKWASYIPKSGQAKADLMELSASKKTQKLGVRLQKSLKNHTEWYRSYLAKATKGQALAYHKNFGISQPEYNDYLKGLSQLSLVKKGDIKLSFSATKDGNIMLTGLPAKPPHNSITYYPKTNKITTPVAVLAADKKINQNNEQSATGRWSGDQWKYEKIQSQQEFTSVQFAIGKLKDKPKNIIYFDMKIAKDGTGKQSSYILFYDTK